MSRRKRTVSEVGLAKVWTDWLVDSRTGNLEMRLLLSARERNKERGASFPTVQDIFLHTLDRNAWWLESAPRGRQESHRKVKGPLSRPPIR